jgi:hypothetical protein
MTAAYQTKLLKDRRTLAQSKVKALAEGDAKRAAYEKWIAELDEQIMALGG